MTFPNIVQDLIDYFERLPGVGPKTAQRLVFYLLSFPDEELKNFGGLISGLKERTCLCENCKNISEETFCSVCKDSSRVRNQILVVASPLDVVALEKTDYNGHYHVLHGLIDPLSYIGPEDIYIESLLKRIKELIRDEVVPVEIVLATNASMEGESTAHFIQDLLRERYDSDKIVITRIGRGLPVGGDIEYADDNTLSRALDGRKEI